MHFYVSIRTALQALRGCLRGSHPQSMSLASFSAWGCVQVPRFCTWHMLSIFPCCCLPFSRCFTLLLLCPCPSTLCSQLFCRWSWLHHVAAFVWSEIPQAPSVQGRRQHFASWCNAQGRHWSKKTVTKGDMKGDVDFLQCFLIAATLAHGQKVWCVEVPLLQMNMWWAKLKSSMKGRQLFQEVMDFS